MKNWKKCFGFIAIVAIIGLLVACPEDGGNDGNENHDGGFLGNKLELSGQVYLVSVDDNYNASYQNFIGNLSISPSIGGSGAVNNGILNYSIGKPTNLETINVGIVESLFYYWDNLHMSKTNVKGFYLSSLSVISNDYDLLQRFSYSTSIGNNSAVETSESVMYVYVDKDCTLTGNGKTKEVSQSEDLPFTITSSNFDIAFKAGWNAVYTKSVTITTWTGAIDNPTNENIYSTVTVSMSAPSSLKWILVENH